MNDCLLGLCILVVRIPLQKQVINPLEIYSTTSEVHKILDAPEGVRKENKVLSNVKKVYKRTNSPVTSELEFLFNECKKRKLNFRLVASIQAEESGWGKSIKCQSSNNCFGFGKFKFNSYKEGTKFILDRFVKYYQVDTAEEMSKRGYNQHQSWIDNVNSIQNSFR